MKRPSFARFQRGALGASLVLAACGGLVLAACGGHAPTPAPAPQKPVAATPLPDARYASLPQPQEAGKWTFPEVKTFTLGNGLRVWFLERGDAPLASIHLVVPEGGANDPAGREGLTLLALDLLDEGAGRRSALEVSDELGRLATDYEAQAGVDYGLLSMNALAENFESSIALLADFVQRPKLDRAEFDRRKNHHLAQAIAQNSNPSSLLGRAYHAALFGTGYASRLPEGTHASLSSIDFASVQKRVRELTVAEGVELVVAGALDEARVKKALETHFGSWKGKRRATEIPLAPLPENASAHLVHFDGAAQSSIAVLTRAGGSEDPKYFDELVMNRQLGEAFTSRINMNLRENKGYTYGAFSTFRRYRRAGFFGVVTNVKTDVTAESISEIFRELSDACGPRPLTAAERDDGVAGLLLGYPLRFERLDEVGFQLTSLPIHRRPANFFQTWPDRVNAVTVAAANQALVPYCDAKKYRVVVVGDSAHVRPALERLNFKVEDVARSVTAVTPGAAPGKATPGKAAP